MLTSSENGTGVCVCVCEALACRAVRANVSGWVKTADTEFACVAVGGASSSGAAAGSARSQGGVLQCHWGLRAPQPGVHGASGPVGSWHTLLHQLPGAPLPVAC